jgi:deoxyribose-phosphate aldolase
MASLLEKSTSIGQYVDHTVLKQQTSQADIEKLCREAIELSFAAVCVPPYWVSKAKTLLADSTVNVATVIGFPWGYSCLESKVR